MWEILLASLDSSTGISCLTGPPLLGPLRAPQQSVPWNLLAHLGSSAWLCFIAHLQILISYVPVVYVTVPQRNALASQTHTPTQKSSLLHFQRRSLLCPVPAHPASCGATVSELLSSFFHLAPPVIPGYFPLVCPLNFYPLPDPISS